MDASPAETQGRDPGRREHPIKVLGRSVLGSLQQSKMPQYEEVVMRRVEKVRIQGREP